MKQKEKEQQQEKITTDSPGGLEKKNLFTLGTGRDSLSVLFYENPMPAFLCEPESFHILDVNSRAIELYGFSKDEFLVKSLQDLVASEPPLFVEEFKNPHLDPGRIETVKHHKKKDGNIVTVTVHSRAMHAGERAVVLCVIHDLTSLFQTEPIQQIIYQVSQAAEKSPNLYEMYCSIHNLVSQVMPAKNLSVSLFSSQTNEISISYFVDEWKESKVFAKPDKSIQSYIIGHGKSVICDFATIQTLVNSGSIVEEAPFPSSLLGIPLVVEGNTIGVLEVHDYENSNAYGEREKEILEFVSLQIVNIIERRLTFLAIQEKEDNLRVLIENTDDAIWSIGIDFCIVTINTSAEKKFLSIFNKEIHEGGHAIESMPEEHRLEWVRFYRRAFHGERFMVEKHFSFSHDTVELEIFFNPIVDHDGSVTGVSVFAKDVTEKNRIEKELFQSQLNYRNLIDRMGEGLLYVDNDDVILFANKRMSEMFGYSFDEFSGKVAHDLLVHEDDRNIVIQKNSLRLENVSDKYVVRMFTKSGVILWVQITGSPIQDVNGNVIGSLGIHTDITEQRRIEQALHESEDRYKAFITQSSEAIWRFEIENPISILTPEDEQIDLFYRYTYLAECNDAMAKMYGFENAEQILNVRLKDMLIPTDSANLLMLKNFIRSGYRLTDVETHENDKEGNQKYFLNNLVGIVENGKLKRAWGTQRDITKQKMADEALRESESRFRVLTETSSASVFIYQGLRIKYVNRASEELLGYSKDELYRMDFWDMVHPEYREMVKERGLARQRGEDVPTKYEFKIVTKNGAERWVDLTSGLIEFEGAQAVLGTAFDITERKRAESLQIALYKIAKAAEDAKKLHELFEAVHKIISEVMFAANFYIALYDADTDLLSFPYFVDEVDVPSPVRKPGRGLTEYVLRTGESLLCDEVKSLELAENGEAELVGAPSPIWLGVPLIIEKKTIGVMAVQHYSDPAAFGQAEKSMLEYVSSQVASTIDKKRKEELLQSNERHFRALIENSSDVIIIVDRVAKILYQSPSGTKVLGFEPEELIGLSGFSLVHPNDLQNVKNTFEKMLAMPNQSISLQFRGKHKDGTWRWLDATGTNMLDDPNIRGIVANYRDITERVLATEELKESEERYRSLVESARDAIFTLSPNGFITSFNPAFEYATGWKVSDLLGKSITSVLHKDDVALANQAFQEALSGKQPAVYELRVKAKGEGAIVGEFTITPQIQKGKVIGVLGIARDITERRKLEEQIQYMQKMESIGILAGGVAHDFNNILTIINTSANALPSLVADPLKHTQRIETIEKTVQRGANLVRQLLTLAKKSQAEFTQINVLTVVEEIIKLLRETFPRTITIVPEIALDNVKIMADANQLHQALLNLCLNAKDAMAEGGVLTIRSKFCSMTEVKIKFPEANKSEYLCISVADTGTGIDEETRSHIFDPFFTTKEKGQGTGLGLAVVYGIVQGHHGFIDLESTPGAGSTFSVYLPLPSKHIETTEEDILPENEILGGNETLLLVEDEDEIVDLLAAILSGIGYNILIARDGVEAVELYTKHKDEIALVLTDLGLPKLPGWEAFQKMMEIKPDVKAILASGYLDDKVRADLISGGAKDYLQKPYDLNYVIKRIREVIDDHS